VNAGQIPNLRILANSFHHEGEHNLSFALNSHVCAQIAQRALREDAVTRTAKDNRSLGQASATRYDFLHRSKQELRMQHVLVIDVSYRDADGVGAEVLDGVPKAQHRVALEHQVEQGHLVAGVLGRLRHTG
jgi:hypothetical protein